MIGVTRLDPFHVYKGNDVPHKNVIIMACRMEYDELKHGASLRHVREVMRSYAEMGSLSANLAKQIRGMGYPARAHSLRFEQINMIPVSWTAKNWHVFMIFYEIYTVQISSWTDLNFIVNL